jgi:dTDP-glucose 4,6-dehydratase
MRVLVTGGAGFIGSAVVRHLIGRTEHTVFNYDNLTYAACPGSLAEVADHPRYAFRRGDICDSSALEETFREFRPDAVMHLAAETHVDRSIDGPEAFVQTNVIGTMRLLEVARSYLDDLSEAKRTSFRFHQVSTDEVFGALGPHDAPFSRASPYDPHSPYAASKAASDHFVRAWSDTYGLPVLVSNCTNNYGPYHFPEKLIPLVIIKALLGEPLPVYGRGENVRDWLHVEDHADALIAILERGRPGNTFLIGGGAELRNLDVVTMIAELVDQMAQPLPGGRSRTDLITFVADRPAHDFRYAMDIREIERDLGWRPSRTFESGLRETVAWFLANRAWWQPIRQRYRGERLGTVRPGGNEALQSQVRQRALI